MEAAKDSSVTIENCADTTALVERQPWRIVARRWRTVVTMTALLVERQAWDSSVAIGGGWRQPRTEQLKKLE